MRFETWRPALLAEVVRFWNRAFAGKRNFFPVTEALFRRRVIEKRTAVEAFDPKGWIAAREGAELAGFIHAGVRPEAACRALDPSWRGGTQGYVGFLWVDPAHRRKGAGTELWRRALARLEGTRQVVVDGQCLNPFYGNSEGPFAPFWGPPEGVGVEWGDSATQKFLARKGFAPRFRGVHLALDLGRREGAPLEGSRRAMARAGFELGLFPSACPEVGRPEGERRPVPPGLDFESAAAAKGGKTAGTIVYFPLREVREGLWAIYEASVSEPYRGKALGRRLLQAALARMRGAGARSVEVLTIPELSPAAEKLYGSEGFERVGAWAIY